MNRFDLHREYPAACLHAVGLSASVNGTRLLSLSTIADVKISNPPWVNFQSAGWVSFQSAPTTRWKSARPEQGKAQQTANSVLKDWHPGKRLIDELIALPPDGHISTAGGDYELYVAYQKPVNVKGAAEDSDLIIPRTFEDALILENLAVAGKIEGSITSAKVRDIVAQDLSGDDLEDELFELLKTAEKAAFALDCLMLEDPKALKPPSYIAAGLKWFEGAVGKDIAQSEIQGAEDPHDH